MIAPDTAPRPTCAELSVTVIVVPTPMNSKSVNKYFISGFSCSECSWKDPDAWKCPDGSAPDVRRPRSFFRFRHHAFGGPISQNDLQHKRSNAQRQKRARPEPSSSIRKCPAARNENRAQHQQSGTIDPFQERAARRRR